MIVSFLSLKREGFLERGGAYLSGGLKEDLRYYVKLLLSLSSFLLSSLSL